MVGRRRERPFDRRDSHLPRLRLFQETASKRADRKRFRRVLDFIDDFEGQHPLAVLVSRYSRLSRNKHDEATIDEFVDLKQYVTGCKLVTSIATA